jgi:amino acid transporter
MAEYRNSGDLGRFEGFLACLWSAAFTIVGPEYISMAAAETKRPRTYIKTAFKTVYWRFGVFFVFGALCVGIVVPYNDPTLDGIIQGTSSGGGTAAASPYVIAMANLGISGLPHLVNALICTSIFSAGNTYFYAASRALYGLSLEGRAPKFLQRCTRGGVPIWCIAVTTLFPCLSFLQVSSGSAVVLTWLVNLVTAGSLINFVVMCVTYLCFYQACKVQGVDRRTFPYYGWGQPYLAWVALAGELLVLFFFGYSSFDPPNVETFFSCYTMLILAPITYIFWKLYKRTKFVKPERLDLVWERPIVDAYEASFISPPVGFWTEMAQLMGFKKGKQDDHRNSISA